MKYYVLIKNNLLGGYFSVGGGKDINKIEVNNLEGLIENIEGVRSKLNKQILKGYRNINNREALVLSRELDELLVKYLKIIQEK